MLSFGTPVVGTAHPMESIVYSQGVAVGHADSDQYDDRAHDRIRLIHYDPKYTNHLNGERQDTQ